jgi:AcrR family transcriptional regulator
MSTRAYNNTLRQKQTELTRQTIIEAALSLIAESPRDELSHEQIARRAGIGLRTVYRYFPERSELLTEVWLEVDHRLQLSQYPDTEEKMLAAVNYVFNHFDQNADLIRGLLESDAGREMRERDNPRRRKGVERALEGVTVHLSEEERLRVVGIFQVLFGARAWETLRYRSHLPPGESAKAIEWAMKTLLTALRQQSTKVTPGKTKRNS